VLNELDYVPAQDDIAVEIPEGEAMDVRLHDGSHLRIRKLGRDFDPTNRLAALAAIEDAESKGEVLTGVLYVNTGKPTFLDLLNLPASPSPPCPNRVCAPPAPCSKK